MNKSRKTFIKITNKLTLAGSIGKNIKKPVFEISETKAEKLKNLAQIVLAILAISGAITFTAFLPGFLSVIKTFYAFKKIRMPRYEEKNKKIARTFYYLKERGYIEMFKDRNDFKIVLTEKGRARSRKLEEQDIVIQKQETWDGKFWQVAADIPTKYRKGADSFRREILKLGFFPLQRTLWFYPFDPRKEIELISKKYLIFSFVTVMKIEMLDPSDRKTIQNYFREKKVI